MSLGKDMSHRKDTILAYLDGEPIMSQSRSEGFGHWKSGLQHGGRASYTIRVCRWGEVDKRLLITCVGGGGSR